MNQVPSIEEKIAARIDQSTAGALVVSEKAGGLDFTNAGQAMEFAKLMAISGIAVPKHLRGNPGACLGIVIQAIEWRLSPYAVANKSYSVNDRLAYESQLIQAVILQRAPIRGRLKVEFKGEGANRVCRVWAELRDTGEVVDYESPPFGAIPVKNSPLWKGDPDQQHFYYSARALCRRHFPDVLLGIYARDEVEESEHIGPDRAKDVTPAPRSIGDKLDALAGKPAEEPGDAVFYEAPSVDELEERARRREAATFAPNARARAENEAETKNGEGSKSSTISTRPAETSAENPIGRPQAAAEQHPADEVDPVAIARQRGAEAKRAGAKRSATPAEYRAEGREAEAKAWAAGWREEWERDAPAEASPAE